MVKVVGAANNQTVCEAALQALTRRVRPVPAESCVHTGNQSAALLHPSAPSHHTHLGGRGEAKATYYTFIQTKRSFSEEAHK